MKRIAKLFILALLATAAAPPAQDACLEEVRSIYKKLAAFGRNGDKNTYYMDYTVRTATSDSSEGIAESGVKMWMAQDKLEVISSQFEIYQDGNNVFMVLPERKMLLRSDPPEGSDKARTKRRNYLEFLQDTLFMVSKVVSCERVAGQGGADKKVRLALRPGADKFFGISHITFYIRSSAQQVSRVCMEYYTAEGQPSSRPQGIVYQEYVFNTMSFDCRDKTLSSDVSSRFLKGGKLTPAYASYKLIDNRNKKGIVK